MTHDRIELHLAALTRLLDGLPLAEKVDALNKIREALHARSPFAEHPVDLIRWVPIDTVVANDYNPNSVAPPEMELLHLSIQADGFTQPIVTNLEDDTRVVIDGFHRNRVGREYPDVADMLHGYLPVVQIREGSEDRSDRMASTIRHNRARGKHQVERMSDIVTELKRRNWSNGKIAKQLGMDDDEVLRLSQIAGLAEMFADREFSEAWEHTGPAVDPTVEDDDGPVDLEWMSGVTRDVEPGWDDRTELSSVLYGEAGAHRGTVQRSRFNDEWFWYAYTVPMSEGRAPTLAEAKMCVESLVQ